MVTSLTVAAVLRKLSCDVADAAEFCTTRTGNELMRVADSLLVVAEVVNREPEHIFQVSPGEQLQLFLANGVNVKRWMKHHQASVNSSRAAIGG